MQQGHRMQGLFVLSAFFSLTGIPLNLAVQAQGKTDKTPESSSKPDALHGGPGGGAVALTHR